MGNGSWDPQVYATTTQANVRSGNTFAYTAAVSSGKVVAAVHDLLNPQWLAGAGSPYEGKRIREARDNADHPNSVPIFVSFDETGSMEYVPRILQTKLGGLFTLLLRKGYVEDPQLAVGAYGDSMYMREVAPLQFGQFESDNRADETLDNIYLEGKGGGNGGESVGLTLYFLAFHTATDAWEKRGKKGYAFTVGDEIPHAKLSRQEVLKYVYGIENSWDTRDQQMPTLPFEGDFITIQDLVKAVQEKWEYFHLIIDNYSAQGQQSQKVYGRLLGENAITLEDPDAVAETIAMLIGIGEDAIDLDEGLNDLNDVGLGGSTGAVSKALARRGSTGGGGRVVVANSPTDLDVLDDDDRVTRL